MRTNYVLIDYENVQPTSLFGLNADHFRVLVFVGACQNKLTFEMAAAMQKLGANAQYVKIAGNGSNALDFHIAFHIGQLAAQDPTGFFHIISKDTGFDPLIQHLKERKVLACRSKDVADIPLLKAANSKSVPEKIDVVVADLLRRGTSKPGTLQSLSNTINALFLKQLTDDQLQALLNELQTKGFVVVDGAKLSYELPVGADYRCGQAERQAA